MKKNLHNALCGCFALASLLSSTTYANDEALSKTVHQLWQALSHRPNASADTVTLKHLFHSQAQIFGGIYRKGEATLIIDPIQTFIRNSSKKSKKGFYECEIARETKVYENFAQVYSVVESRYLESDTQPAFVGVNSLQLYKTEEGWKILSLYYHVENKELPIALTQGKTGVCLPS